MSKLVAIHQPNFFPWLGYFQKIALADTFIFLDDVEFAKSGGTWSNRVKLMNAGQPWWMTAPVDRRYHGARTIKQMQFSVEKPWRNKLLKSIEMEYRKHPFFNDVFDTVAPLVLNEASGVCDYNIHAITALSEGLGLRFAHFECSSAYQLRARSNELLCRLTTSVGGDTYLLGGGAEQYHDECTFRNRGVKVIRQDFMHPVYAQRQCREFHHGLSVIDALMNVGWSGVRELLKAPA